MPDILKLITDVLVEVLGISASTVELHTKLEEDLNIDSLDRMEILMGLEEKLEMEMEDDVMDNIVTVQDLVTAIDRALGKRQ